MSIIKSILLIATSERSVLKETALMLTWGWPWSKQAGQRCASTGPVSNYPCTQLDRSTYVLSLAALHVIVVVTCHDEPHASCEAVIT